MLKEKLEAVRASSGVEAAEVLRLEEKITHIENHKRKIMEAIKA